MATPLRNLSAILSPKFLSPLAGHKLQLPKSDVQVQKSEKLVIKSEIGVKRRLNFTPQATTSLNQLLVPGLVNFESGKQVEKSELQISNNNNHRVSNSSQSTLFRIEVVPKLEDTLEINTPNKKDLLRNGLDNFQCRLSILGKGKFGTVIKASYKGVTVAAKLVKHSTRLKEENAIPLNHKNIVKTIEIIKNSSQNYALILMEHLPYCRDLQHVIENSNITKLIKKFAIDITRGLKFCHDNKILHLDLKPKNILVDGLVCKICDFGNSVNIGEDFGEFKNNGTAVYTAPEILLGQHLSVKCDIYSLGVIFGQMKFGETPFQGMESLETIIYNVGKRNLKPFANLENLEIGDSFVTIIKNCLNRNPNNRPTTEEILEKLDNHSNF